MAKAMKDKMTQDIEARLIQAAISMEEDIMDDLDTSPQGLTEIEAKKRLEKHGKNQIAHDKPPAWYVQLLACFKNPFILILLSLAAFSYFTDEDIQAVIIITTMVTVSVIITFTQEFRSTRTAEKLKAMVKTTSSVSRRSERREIDMELLVPGDIIHLSAGDMVPADVRLIAAKDLYVGESALTGEAMPVEKMDNVPRGVLKAPGKQRNTPLNALDLNNMCYMGTNIISGSATAVVIATVPEPWIKRMAVAMRKGRMTMGTAVPARASAI